MGLELCYIIKKKTNEGKMYKENWNDNTVNWSSGYRRAMREIDEILDMYLGFIYHLSSFWPNHYVGIQKQIEQSYFGLSNSFLY